jgi:hypothetical protein
MSRLLDSLSTDVRLRLRTLGQPAEDVDWPVALARNQGWQVANAAYLAAQRQWGVNEMQALLRALDLEPPLDPAMTREVLLAAIELYFHTSRTDADVTVEDNRLRIDISRCPVFERFTDFRWGGLTACGCFARRRGWYQAMGIEADEELVTLRKWGDPVCELVIRLASPATVAVPMHYAGAARPAASG